MSRSPLSRAKIRSMAARRCGFTPRSTSQLTYLNEEVDNALMRLASDCPDAFLHNSVQVDVLLGQDLGAISKGIKTPTGLPSIINTRILEIVDSDGTTLSGSWLPKVDGTWDGRMWLRVKTSESSQPYIIQSREWFTGGQLNDMYYVSTVDPLPFDASTTITDVTIFQRYVYFPSDTSKVKAQGQDSGDYYANISIIEPHTARNRMYNIRDDVSTGHIQYMWRDHKHVIQTPTEEPDTVAGPSSWDNAKFPKGEYEFCFTYVWGRRSDFAHGEAPRGFYDPLWESAPSPKGTFTMTDQTSTSLKIQCTNIDAQVGFSHPDLTGTYWEGRAGYRIRIYVRVKSLVAGTGDARFRRIETSDKFLLLTEIEPTNLIGGVYASYDWDGTQIPDFERWLKASPGYYGYSMYPFASEDKVLDFAVRRTPDALEDDAMVVHMQPEGKEALVALIASAIHRSDGDKGAAEVEEARYRNLAELIKQRYSNPGGYGLPRGMGDYYVVQPEVIATS